MFRIANPGKLAVLWGEQKKRDGMTYDKLARALRYYYKVKIIEKVRGKRLTYRLVVVIIIYYAIRAATILNKPKLTTMLIYCRFLKHPKKIVKGQRGAKPGVPHHPRVKKEGCKRPQKVKHKSPGGNTQKDNMIKPHTSASNLNISDVQRSSEDNVPCPQLVSQTVATIYATTPQSPRLSTNTTPGAPGALEVFSDNVFLDSEQMKCTIAAAEGSDFSNSMAGVSPSTDYYASPISPVRLEEHQQMDDDDTTTTLTVL